MNEECFLTDGFCTINWILDRHIIDIEKPADEKEKARNVISPQFFIDVLVEETNQARKHEGNDQDNIVRYPKLVGGVVEVHLRPVFQHRSLTIAKFIYLYIFFKIIACAFPGTFYHYFFSDSCFMVSSSFFSLMVKFSALVITSPSPPSMLCWNISLPSGFQGPIFQLRQSPPLPSHLHVPP